MKILFITDNFPPESNAPAIRTAEHSREWSRAGAEITLVTGFPNFPEGKVFPGYRNRLWQWEEIEGIRVLRVWTFIAPNSGTFLRTLDYLSFCFTSFLAGLLLRRRDLVVATSPQFFTAVSGVLIAAIKRVPFVMEVRDIWPASIQAVGAIRSQLYLRSLEKVELWLYRSAQKIITVTQSAKQNLVSRGVPSNKVGVILNGVDSAFRKSAQSQPSLPSSLNFSGQFVVGYIGTLGLAHDLKNVVEAADLLRKHSKIRFLFVGAGSEKNGIEALARAKGLTNVTFVSRRPHGEIPAYWKLCDVALISLKDTPLFSGVIPSKMFEATSLGIPSLMVCPKGEATKMMLGWGCALHVPPGNPILLAESIRTLSDQPGKIRALAEKALQVAPQLDRKVQAAKMFELLVEAVDGTVRRAA